MNIREAIVWLQENFYNYMIPITALCVLKLHILSEKVARFTASTRNGCPVCFFLSGAICYKRCVA